MYSIGIPELVLILDIALVVFGPGKLPEIGKAVGKVFANSVLLLQKIIQKLLMLKMKTKKKIKSEVAIYGSRYERTYFC